MASNDIDKLMSFSQRIARVYERAVKEVGANNLEKQTDDLTELQVSKDELGSTNM